MPKCKRPQLQLKIREFPHQYYGIIVYYNEILIHGFNKTESNDSFLVFYIYHCTKQWCNIVSHLKGH